MIRFVEHGEINADLWDHCIQQSFNGNVSAFSWYLDVVCPEWTALVEGDYQRVMPLPSWKKAGLRYLAQPFFTQQLGVFSIPELYKEKVEEFIAAIPSFFRTIDINLNSFNSVSSGLLNPKHQTNLELDLISSYETLQAAYSSNLRRNLKKELVKQLTLMRNVRPEDVVELFRNNKGKEISLLGEEQYKMLLRLVYQLIHRGVCEVWGAFDGHNQLVAGIIWTFSHQKAILQFSGASEEGRELGAMPFLIDSFIQEYSGQSLTLDFEGSNDPNLARFYGSFGSRKVGYVRIQVNRMSGPAKMMLYLYRQFRKLSKK